MYSNEYIECPDGLPSVDARFILTIDDNRVKGAFYLDVGGTYTINDHSNVYFKVDNLLDKGPEPSPAPTPARASILTCTTSWAGCIARA